MMKVRGSLISLIHSSTFRSGSSFSNDTTSLTLMTVDVDKAMLAFEDIHELWANVLHLGIAVYVLALQMSWACVAPIVVCIGKLLGDNCPSFFHILSIKQSVSLQLSRLRAR
jgi:hypothetical protein